MIRKTLKNTSKHEKLQEFIKKSKVPPEFLSANRKMISRGVLLGLLIAFIPMPMQMAAVLLFMPFFRFNVPIALAMCWITNPFTMAPMYFTEYHFGAFLLGMETKEVELSVAWFSENMDAIFVPLYTGAVIFSLFFGFLGYWAVNHFWKTSVHEDKQKHRHHR
jgi:uncharacterized protein (DUF2062 family)